MRHGVFIFARVTSGILISVACLSVDLLGQNCTRNPATAKPEIASNLAEGVKEVSGRVGQITAAANYSCTARVELWLRLVAVSDGKPTDPELAETTDDHGNQARTLLGSATATGGQFDIKLSDPLVAGQTLFLIETITETTGSTGTDETPIFSDGVMRVAAFGSWGLVRAYFTSGFLLSQDQGSFSQSSLFLAFTLDKTWKMPGYYFGRTHSDGTVTPRLKWPPGINSFFETRLTSIPVNACAQPSGGTGTSGSSGTSACATTSATGTTTTLDTFLANRKTARLDLGAYIPFTMTGWAYKGTPNTLFLAPLAKIGFDTPAGSLSQTQPSNATGGATTSGTVTPLNPTNFYKFYTFGGRFGHYAMTSSRDDAPETLSYLDFTFGRFSNLESLVQTGTQMGSRERLWRISVEGILKVPSTPLVIGFNANVGMNNPGAPKIIQGAGDDLRFLFGARFDVAKLLAHIGQVAP